MAEVFDPFGEWPDPYRERIPRPRAAPASTENEFEGLFDDIVGRKSVGGLSLPDDPKLSDPVVSPEMRASSVPRPTYAGQEDVPDFLRRFEMRGDPRAQAARKVAPLSIPDIGHPIDTAAAYYSGVPEALDPRAQVPSVATLAGGEPGEEFSRARVPLRIGADIGTGSFGDAVGEAARQFGKPMGLDIPEPEHVGRGELIREAAGLSMDPAIGQPHPTDTVGNDLWRRGIGTGVQLVGDVLTDPTTWILGGENIAARRGLAVEHALAAGGLDAESFARGAMPTVEGLGRIAEALPKEIASKLGTDPLRARQAILDQIASGRRAGDVERLASASFVPGMAQGALQGVEGATKPKATPGERFEAGLGAAISGAFGIGALGHALRREVPRPALQGGNIGPETGVVPYEAPPEPRGTYPVEAEYATARGRQFAPPPGRPAPEAPVDAEIIPRPAIPGQGETGYWDRPENNPPEEVPSAPPVPDRYQAEKGMALELLQKTGELSPKVLVDGLGVSPSRAQRLLRRLQMDGVPLRLEAPPQPAALLPAAPPPEAPIEAPPPPQEAIAARPEPPPATAPIDAPVTTPVLEPPTQVRAENHNTLVSPSLEVQQTAEGDLAAAVREAAAVVPEQAGLEAPAEMPPPPPSVRPEEPIPWSVAPETLRSDAAGGIATIRVPTADLLELAKEDINRPGRAGQKVGGTDKLTRARHFLAEAELSGAPVHTPEVSVQGGKIVIDDGYHRAQAAADAGQGEIPIRVAREDLAKLRDLGLSYQDLVTGARHEPGEKVGGTGRGISRPEARPAQAGEPGVGRVPQAGVGRGAEPVQGRETSESRTAVLPGVPGEGGAAPLPGRPAGRKLAKPKAGRWPKDAQGQNVYPEEAHLSPEARQTLSQTVAARVDELRQAQNAEPTGRRPFVDEHGNPVNKGRGAGSEPDYTGVGSHKAHGLENIEEGPKQIAAAIKKDEGNALELRVREAVLKGDEDLQAHLEGSGDTSFNPSELEAKPQTAWKGDAAEYTGKTKKLHGGLFHEVRLTEGIHRGETRLTQKGPEARFSVRPAPGQRGLPGVAEDVKPRGPLKPIPPKQTSMFGGEMLQPTEANVTEGREAEGPLFTQEQDARAKAEGESQGALFNEPNLPPRTADTMSDAIALSSPSGQMSGRAKDAAVDRLGEKLFGPEGLQRPSVPQPSRAAVLRSQARSLRDLAARGMSTKRYIKEAEALEAQAKTLDEGSGPLFSERPKAPTFYSQLERAASKMPQAMSGKDALRYLMDPKRGVKAEELKWTGLDDFLSQRMGQKVTPKDVQDFLAANKVEVKEVTLGGKASKEAEATFQEANETASDAQERLSQELARALKDQQTPEARAAGFRTNGEATRLASGVANGDSSAMDQASYLLGVKKGQHPLVQETYDAWSRSNALRNAKEREQTTTKFSQYQEPGGENYRELLLTLPRKTIEGPDQSATMRAFKLARDAGEDWDTLGPNGRQRFMDQAERAVPGEFRSSHFDEPNILAHVRFNDRTDAQGKKTLFIEEVQSDWAQKGRKEGFRPPESGQGAAKEKAWRAFDAYRTELNRKYPNGHGQIDRDEVSPEEWSRFESLRNESDAASAIAQQREHGIPSAPFVGATEDWSALALKHILKHAAENGYDKIAWTKGETQAARYDLSKQIQEISWSRAAPKAGVKEARYNLNIWPKGQNSFDVKGLDPKALVDHVGKELADKIVASAEERGDFTGLDLKVGGEGMKGFYDQILPAVAGKIGKKFGAKVGETSVDIGNIPILSNVLAYTGPTLTMDEVAEKTRHLDDVRLKEQGRNVLSAMQRGTSFEDAMGEQSHALAEVFNGNLSNLWRILWPRKSAVVHAMNITDAMRRSVTEEGQPLFRKGPLAGSQDLAERTTAAEGAAIQITGGLDLASPYDSSRGHLESLAPKLKPISLAAQGVANRLISLAGAKGANFAGFSTDGDYFGVTLHGKDIRLSLPAIRAEAQARVARKGSGSVTRETARIAVNKLLHEIAHVKAEAETPAAQRASLEAGEGHGPEYQTTLQKVYRAAAPELPKLRKHLEARLASEAAPINELLKVSDEAWKEAGHGRYRDEESARGPSGSELRPSGATGHDVDRGHPGGGPERGAEPGGGVPGGGGEPIEAQGRPPVFGGPPEEARFAKVWKPASGFSVPEETFLEHLDRFAADEFSRLRTVERAVGEQGGSTRRLTDMLSRVDRQGGLIAHGIETLQRDMVDPMIGKLTKAKANVGDLGDYLALLHKPDRDAEIARRTEGKVKEGSGWKQADADRRWTELEAKYGKRANDRIAALEPAAKDIRKMRDFELHTLRQGGLISADQEAAWRASMGPDYVPLRGHLDDISENEPGGPGLGRGLDIRGKESQIATGRSTQSENPVGSMLRQAERAVIRAERNKAGQAFADFVRANKLYEMDKVHTKQRFGSSAKTQDILVSGGDPLAAADDFSYKVDGEKHRITVTDPLVIRALQNLSAQDIGAFVHHLGQFTRTYSALQTSFNPEFIATNFARDIQEAGINMSAEQGTKIAYSMLKDIPKAMGGMFNEVHDRGKADEWSVAAREFKQDGGPIGYYQLKESSDLTKALEARVSNSGPGGWKATKRAARAAVDEVVKMNEVVENGTRLAAYKALRDSGVPREKAALIAKGATLNFEKKGEAGPFFNAIWAFFNANAQGAKRLMQVINTPKGKVIAGAAVAAGFAYDKMNRANAGDQNNDGRNDWDDIPPYMKDKNFVFMRSKGRPIIFPMPYGWGAVFNVGRIASSVVAGKKTPAEGAVSTAVSLWNAFTPPPLGGADSLYQFVHGFSPTFVQPFLEHGVNKDFTGRQIVPEQRPGEPTKPPSELYGRGVSPVSKWATDLLNRATGGDKITPGFISVSPELVDHYVKWISGGMGKTAMNTLSTGASLVKGEAPEIRNVPFARRFVYEESKGREGSIYWEELQKARTLVSARKQYEKSDDPAMRARGEAMPQEKLDAAADMLDLDTDIRRLRKAGRDEGEPFKYDDEIKEFQKKALRLIERGKGTEIPEAQQ